MNVWKLTAAGRLEEQQTEPSAPREGKIRVRVTKVLLNSVDADVYRGAIKAKYPLVPGRFAVGLVSEENAHPLYPKGTRVLLHAFCPEEYTGTAKRDFTEDEVELRGQSSDGFLSDFVYVSPDDMTVLPDSATDNRALLVHHVALAQATLDALDVQKGQHVAVVGANLFGIIICRLLIYRQVSPLLVDGDASRLAFARSCGIYYTLEADDDLTENVGKITGGRLASGAVYVTSASGNDKEIAFGLCARGKNVVISGLNTGAVELDLGVALKKQLSLHCVWDCLDYLEAAINLVANHATDTGAFRWNMLAPADVAQFLDTYHEHPERDVSEINVVSLI